MEKLQIPKMKSKSNWNIWKLQIESSLQYHDFEGVMTGVVTELARFAGDATNQQNRVYKASVKRFKKANGFTITLITTYVEEELLQLIIMFKTAQEMWDKLQASYEQVSEQRLENLYVQLFKYEKNPVDSIAFHLSKLQRLWLELNKESARVDHTQLPQTLLIMRILSTLPDDYLEVRTTRESVPHD